LKKVIGARVLAAADDDPSTALDVGGYVFWGAGPLDQLKQKTDNIFLNFYYCP